MRTKVNLGLKGMSVTVLVGYANQIVTKMTGNTYFPAPSPTLLKIAMAANALNTAYTQAQGGGRAKTALMYQARTALETLLISEGHYVEDVANDPANSSTGPDVIILSAGMDPKHFTPRQKQVFTAIAGDKPGTVILSAPHVRRGTHEWQYTLDPADPEGWTEVDPTSKATALVSGLASGKRYYFRHRSVSKDGPTAWDGPIDMIVS